MSKRGSGPFGIISRLTLILVVTVALLTGYSYVVAKFAGQVEDPTLRALSKVLEGAQTFNPVLGENGETLYYEAYNDAGILIGFGFIKTGRGMWGDIQIAGGIDLDYRLTGLRVLEQSETPGLGSRIIELNFLDQFTGLKADEVKIEKYGGRVDAITGATISSRAVTDIVRKEVEKVTESRGG
jgi:electron transport complex protein RnfG